MLTTNLPLRKDPNNSVVVRMSSLLRLRSVIELHLAHSEKDQEFEALNRQLEKIKTEISRLTGRQ